MTSHPPAQCCTIGVKHEGTPSGELVDLNGTSTYVAKPPNGTSKYAILVLTDVIGHRFVNAQLIADQFAANGYTVLMPDLFAGDALPLNPPADLDFNTWRAPHTPQRVDPVVAAAIKHLRSEMGCERIGGVGYCFGAKYVARFSRKGGGLDAGFFAHPSFVETEELRGVAAPLSIAAAETDNLFPPDKRQESERILNSMDIPWQITLYSDVEHGFGVRADLSKRRVKWAKEQAFLQAVRWFDEHIKDTESSKL